MSNTTSGNPHQQSIRLATRLTYFGAVPFLFAALLSLSQHINLPEFLGGEIRFADYKAKVLMHTYGVVILSFLGGIQWGFSLRSSHQRFFLITSNVLALLSWFSLMALANAYALILLLCGFLAALITDRKAHQHDLIPLWFWQLRKRITPLVCIAFLVVLFG